LGFVSNDKEKQGQLINGVPILGDDGWLLKTIKDTPIPQSIALGIEQPRIKRKIVQLLGKNDVDYPNLIHPNVVMPNMYNTQWESMGMKIGDGNIICAGSVLTCGVKIGEHTTINMASIIGCDVEIGNYVSIGSGVSLPCGNKICEGSNIETGTRVLNNVNIGKWSCVKTGAIVSCDVEDNTVAMGLPAKMIKQKQDGWHLY